MKNRAKILSSVFFLLLAVFFLLAYREREAKELQYYHHAGQVFGTYYNIRYESPQSYERDILRRLTRFDESMSTFNKRSVISRINKNESQKTDTDFETMYATAKRIYDLSDGAFDITVAPLVNAWGFGFSNREEMTDARVEQLRSAVGFEKIRLDNHRLIKSDDNVMLDASAIAKGQSCDVIADLLKSKGCQNILVDIGGEVVAYGVNESGKNWRIGISKPTYNLTNTNNEVEQVVSSDTLCMASSGNYRQFYFENGVRRSHTIDPRTGYPVNHSLLSASVVAPSCMEADALATACMVLGADSAMKMIEGLKDTECYLIFSKDSTYRIEMSSGFSRYLAD